MKYIKIISLILVVFISFSSLAKARYSGYGYTNSKTTQVKGYSKSNGKYIKSYIRTKSNSTQRDNYSTKGNYNPYTGKKGTKNAYK